MIRTSYPQRTKLIMRSESFNVIHGGKTGRLGKMDKTLLADIYIEKITHT